MSCVLYTFGFDLKTARLIVCNLHNNKIHINISNSDQSNVHLSNGAVEVLFSSQEILC